LHLTSFTTGFKNTASNNNNNPDDDDNNNNNKLYLGINTQPFQPLFTFWFFKTWNIENKKKK